MSRQPVPLETSEPIVPPALTSANGHVLRTPVPLPALAPDPTTCATCGAQADEPPRNPTPIIDGDGSIVIVCRVCRQKARQRELVAGLRPDRTIRIAETPRDPRLAIAAQVEQAYTLAAITTALEAQNDLWQFIAILDDRLVNSENTTDRVRDAQQFRQLFFDKLVALPTDGEIHVLVSRGQRCFGYNSREFERAVRESRVVERQVTLGEVEPWPEPVDVASVLDDIVGKIREFLVVTDEQIDAMALWAANTHTYAFFDFVPYLLLTAPEKRTAKTRAQDVLAPITNTPLVASHLTAATAFRALDKFHPTLFIDEAHNYIKESKDHEAVMTGGFQKGKPVLRCAETTYEPTLFDTFGPKCFASIGDLQDTVMDRSIIIRMRRKLPTEHRRWWFRGARIEREELRPIARKLRRWAEDSAETLQRYEPTANDVPHELFVNDRAVDAWLPLFAIAEQAGSTWPERARRAAVALSVGAAATAPETTGTELLRNIRSIFYRTTSDGQPLEPLDVLGLSDLCARLTARPEWLWASYSNGKPLTAYRLLALLKPYGVAPTQRRVRHGRARGLWRDDLEPVWARYLDDEAVSRLRETVSQPPETPPDGGDGHSCRNGETRETGETRLQTSTFLGTSSTDFVSRDRETTRETTGETSRPKWTDVDQAVFEQRWAQLAHTP